MREEHANDFVATTDEAEIPDWIIEYDQRQDFLDQYDERRASIYREPEKEEN